MWQIVRRVRVGVVAIGGVNHAAHPARAARGWYSESSQRRNGMALCRPAHQLVSQAEDRLRRATRHGERFLVHVLTIEKRRRKDWP